MLTMRFRLLLGIIITFALGIKSIDAQVIRFNLILPPAFEVTDIGDAPIIIEPVANGQVSENVGVRWIELRTSENVELLIELRPEGRNRMISSKSYYLNDGTKNFSNAKELQVGTTLIPMLNDQKTIEQLDKKFFLSSWLGISTKHSGLLTINYL